MPTSDARWRATASRPVASGRVSAKAAWIWLFALCAVGLIVLLQLRLEAQLVALGSPRAGCRLSVHESGSPGGRRRARAGVHLGRAGRGGSRCAPDRLEVLAALYAGRNLLVRGPTTTIYALQDREDDALVGHPLERAAARRQRAGGVIAFYGLALALWGLAFWLLREDWLALLALAAGGAHLMWQAFTLDPADPDNPWRASAPTGSPAAWWRRRAWWWATPERYSAGSLAAAAAGPRERAAQRRGDRAVPAIQA
jgi:4-hydroxybenzoate polyprenyltransferase